jgi:hypothetical protein
MMRSFWAVVAGFLFIMVLSLGADKIMMSMSPWAFNANGGTTNMAILLLMTVYVAVFAVVGSYLTARLAPSAPMKHALILGVLGLIFSGIGTAKMWDTAPAWFHIINLALVLPYAWYGGRLRENEIGSTPMKAVAA